MISAEYWTCSRNISYYQCWKPLKGIIHPKTKIILSFTHPQVVPNLFEFLSFAEHKRRYFEECGQPRCRWINKDVHCWVNYSLFFMETVIHIKIIIIKTDRLTDWLTDSIHWLFEKLFLHHFDHLKVSIWHDNCLTSWWLWQPRLSFPFLFWPADPANMSQSW